jgi:hypothetical protein
MRHGFAERFVEENLLMSVCNMVLSANHVCDAHLDIIDHDRKVVERVTVGAQQHQVLYLRVIPFLRPINNIFETRLAFLCNFQAYREWLARLRAPVRLFTR